MSLRAETRTSFRGVNVGVAGLEIAPIASVFQVRIMEAALIDQPIRAEVKSAIRRTVEEQYAGMEIVSVDVTRDEDQWGGPLFIVKIAIGDNADLAAYGAKLADLVWHMRNGLAEVNEYTFPIIRMMPKRDAERLARGSR